jgi:hypothetical protein
MKLYATTTSERASKGQGGNKEIAITVHAGSRDNSFAILDGFVRVTDEGYHIQISTIGQDEKQCIDTIAHIPKGKR